MWHGVVIRGQFHDRSSSLAPYSYSPSLSPWVIWGIEVRNAVAHMCRNSAVPCELRNFSEFTYQFANFVGCQMHESWLWSKQLLELLSMNMKGVYAAFPFKVFLELGSACVSVHVSHRTLHYFYSHTSAETKFAKLERLLPATERVDRGSEACVRSKIRHRRGGGTDADGRTNFLVLFLTSRSPALSFRCDSRHSGHAGGQGAFLGI